MDNKIKAFENAEFGTVRTMTINDEPWFVGKDVATILGYAKPENAIANHVDVDDKITTLIQGTGSNYKSKAVIINESGLYSLILSSKLERKGEWISGDVKPTKVGEKAICLTKCGNIVLGEVISYRGELIWEEYNLFGGTFTPVYWMKIPELPKM